MKEEGNLPTPPAGGPQAAGAGADQPAAPPNMSQMFNNPDMLNMVSNMMKNGDPNNPMVQML